MAERAPDLGVPRKREREGAILRGFHVQRNVIGALILRELHTRYGRENIGYLWMILEPMTLAIAIALLHSRAPSHFGTDIKPVPLALVGYCNFIIFRGIFNRAEGSIEASQPILYHRTISVFDVLLARALVEVAGCLLAFVILMGITIAFGVSNFPERPVFLLIGLAAMFLLSFGLGMIVATATYENHAIGRLIHPISYVMLPMSAPFYALEWLPPDFRIVISYVPLAQIFEILRYGQFRGATLEYVDVGYLLTWVVLSNFLGLIGLSVIRSKINMT